MKKTLKKNSWDLSYNRGENFYFFPKEQTVRFLNKYIAKFNSKDQLNYIENIKNKKTLDFGCGIGTTTFMMQKYGFDSYGVDVSKKAISIAKKRAKNKKLKSKFYEINNNTLDFKDKMFYLSISEGVLDSMPFELAKKYFNDIARVTQKYIFLSLVKNCSSIKNHNLAKDHLKRTKFEKDTYQTFYNLSKIKKLIKNTKFEILYYELESRNHYTFNTYAGRYYIALIRKN